MPSIDNYLSRYLTLMSVGNELVNRPAIFSVTQMFPFVLFD